MASAGIWGFVTRGATPVELELGTKVGLGFGLGIAPFFTGDPWGSNVSPTNAAPAAGLSLLGALGNFGTAYALFGHGGAAVAGTSEIFMGGVAAFLGGVEIGRGFNQTWIYFSGGDPFGVSLYNVTHPGQ